VTRERLAHPDINNISYEVKPDKTAAESQSQAPRIDHYRLQMNRASDATLRARLDAAGALATPPLNSDQIVNRAVANSCAGCHQPSGFGLTAANAIGPGMSWPPSLSFVHVDVSTRVFGAGDGFDASHFSGNAKAHDISPALLNAFLPARRGVLAGLANGDFCDCVRRPTELTGDRLLRFHDIVEFSTTELKAEVLAVKRELSGQSDTSMRRIRMLILNAEAARNVELRRLGVGFSDMISVANPVVLSAQRLDDNARAAAKRAAVRRLSGAESPRESITRSFRTH